VTVLQQSWTLNAAVFQVNNRLDEANPPGFIETPYTFPPHLSCMMLI